MNLVTGATGIIGSHVLLNLLQNNQPVVACRRKSSGITEVEKLFSYYTTDYRLLFQKIKWVDLDLNDSFSIELALDGIDTVYHCAGLVSFNKKDKNKLTEVNEQGTRNIVNACLFKKIKAFCYVSSISVINNLDYTLPLNEDVFWKISGSESDYAISKYNAEKEVWRGMEEGLNAVIVNPGVVLSPGFWKQSSSQIFDSCYKGIKFYTTGTTAYVAAQDVAQIMVTLVNQKKFSNKYILSENNYTFQHIFNLIHKNFNKPMPTIKASRGLLKIALRIDSLICLFTAKQPTITSALINSALNEQEYSNQKITTQLNFQFIPINSTIEQICKLYLLEKNA